MERTRYTLFGLTVTPDVYDRFQALHLTIGCDSASDTMRKIILPEHPAPADGQKWVRTDRVVGSLCLSEPEWKAFNKRLIRQPVQESYGACIRRLIMSAPLEGE